MYLVAPDGTRVEPVVIDRDRGKENLFKMTGPQGHHVGYFTLEELAEIVDLSTLREVDE